MTAPLTPEQLAAMRERSNATCSAPTTNGLATWICGRDLPCTFHSAPVPDMRADVLALLAEVERLRPLVDALSTLAVQHHDVRDQLRDREIAAEQERDAALARVVAAEKKVAAWEAIFDKSSADELDAAIARAEKAEAALAKVVEEVRAEAANCERSPDTRTETQRVARLRAIADRAKKEGSGD